ncbi:lipopolysaccharide-induced tumor necrosis factor-alpha factor [Anaeramoeba ignava]|uniref:Lipopolysaccharide-induced tumor necrosis factor-alpha factor n=1 Tax=Anaeramoeba ignava TaxID=1746090 RepID=A0A9Q0L7C9_ANAIG|nr:lipopolysaccharide-induced tumor necrosis factor-alpha factor [Anaeramoeba ignava]
MAYPYQYQENPNQQGPPFQEPQNFPVVNLPHPQGEMQMQSMDPNFQPNFQQGYQPPMIQQPMMMQQPSPMPMMQPVQQTTIVQAINPKALGMLPTKVTCPHCGHTGMTKVEHVAGGLAWMLCIILCLLGCWLGCCLIPFCVDTFQDAEHKCSACGKMIGRYSPM